MLTQPFDGGVQSRVVLAETEPREVSRSGIGRVVECADGNRGDPRFGRDVAAEVLVRAVEPERGVERLAEYKISSKLNAELPFLEHLHQHGHADAEAWLARAVRDGQHWDVAFADPPYRIGLAEAIARSDG